MDKKQAILDAIDKVEHPEIAMPLVDLGMVRDVEYDPTDDGVTLTLVVPFLGIPEVVRDHMLGSLSAAVTAAGGSVKSFSVAQMDDQERQAFFAMENAHWRD
jgi:metal-sulfur cluster biosynthetic enzyme